MSARKKATRRRYKDKSKNTNYKIVFPLCLNIIIGLGLSVWLIYKCVYSGWLVSHPLHDDKLWSQRFNLYFLLLIVVILFQIFFFIYPEQLQK